MKREGFRIWESIQKELKQGKIPADHIIDALLLFTAGIILITPGLITDVCGLLLLMPPVKKKKKKHIKI